MQKTVKLIFLLILANYSFSQEKSILIKHAFLHVGNGETIASAAVGIRDGKIALIKNSLAYSYSVTDWDTVIDVTGMHIYPGFVAPNSTLGLTEIDAVRATNDFQEVGSYNPHVRSQIAYNVSSEVIKTVRSNGILITQATPRSGIISGTSSIMRMNGWNWEDATIQANDGIHINWPNSIQRNNDNRKVVEKSKSYATQKKELYDFFNAALVYSKDKKSTIDLRYEAMKECFSGNKRIYFHANKVQELNDIIEFVQFFSIQFPVIIGGYDANLVSKKLKDAKIPIMLNRPHNLPTHEDDPIYKPYINASLLAEEGILFCIENEGDMEAMNARNIPFLAGTCMAFGLSEEQAIAAVSLNSCKILGIDKDYGSIEVGKSATLFVSKGNALEMRTNQVVLALIDGKFIQLGNKQTDLYNQFKEKYKEK
ncbi:MAG: amidohydrolase family protein [Crocinitomicaceae bacterium]|nr:amidohydrolase family protein [Crocinitomicaceae bacterium]